VIAPRARGGAGSSAAIDETATRTASPSIDELLVKTSRTFALSIPLLPEPTRREVGIAYLLFRIADTFEDAVGWPRERRLAALRELDELLAVPAAASERVSSWLAPPAPISHAGYQELLAASPAVLAAYAELSRAAREVIHHHLGRTIAGMASFVAGCDDGGRLALSTLAELRAYCYAVAGIVGEMLCELFLLDADALAPVAERMRARAAAFGEGLQLVNILKDAGGDAREGRCYLPPGVPRAEVLALARADLEAAREYVRALHEVAAPRGLVAFTALPVLLAADSLDLVEREGPGAKVSRQRVGALVAKLDAALDAGTLPL
jgi:farnesyl-diphosphate farnesyltransferase